VWQSAVPASADLDAVWASGPTDVWAAGAGGAMLHYDGTTWAVVNAATANSLQALWGSSPSDVWAVAGGLGGPNTANLVHWDGQAWSAVDSGTPVNLYGVWGSGAKDVYAVGASGVAGTIQHFDGTSWSTLWSSDTTAPARVGGSSATDVWVVGGVIYPSFGDDDILHATGGSFAPVPSGLMEGLSSEWSAAPDDAWATGPGGLVHWNGQGWSLVSSPLPLGVVGAGGVWGLGAKQVWLVGADPRIAVWDGSAWTIQHADPVGAALDAVGGSDPSHLWAVGENATIMRFDTTLHGTPACGDVQGQCGAAGACAPGQGHLSDYACGGAQVCCVAPTACGGEGEAQCCLDGGPGPRPICHNGASVCPSPSAPCPQHP
jgi:hypothetical protein